MSAADWPWERAARTTARILLDIYREFVYRERDQARWEAGWATICAIGPFPALESNGRDHTSNGAEDDNERLT